MQTLELFVPHDGRCLRILAGSAIVGGALRDPRVAEEPDRSPFITVDVEGNRYNSENLRRYGARVIAALGRHVTRYPTVARFTVPREDLIVIGTVDVTAPDDLGPPGQWVGRGPDPRRWIFGDPVITDPARLAVWLAAGPKED